MSITPEGRIKHKLKQMLGEFMGEDNMYQFWPVPNGLGPSSLDVLICFYGAFIGIECKAPGKKPTPRQEFTIDQIEQARGFAWVVDCAEDIEDLREELIAMREFYHNVVRPSGDNTCKPS